MSFKKTVVYPILAIQLLVLASVIALFKTAFNLILKTAANLLFGLLIIVMAPYYFIKYILKSMIVEYKYQQLNITPDMKILWEISNEDDKKVLI